MAMLATAIPVPAGKTEQWQQFMNELKGPRYADFVASRHRSGVRERTFLQHTPMGDFVVVTLEGDNPGAAFASFGQGTDAFAAWFKQQAKEIHGIDLGAPQAGSLPEMVIDSGA